METISGVSEVQSAAAAGLAWLEEIARSRDLTLAVPRDVPEGDATVLRAFLASLRSELAAFRDVVEAAAESVALNTRELADVVSSTGEHRVMIERTAAAIAEADRGAAHVAQTSEALRALSQTMREATERYDGGVDEVLAGLAELVTAVDGAARFAAEMDRDSSNISVFVERLARIARQARLLSINAAIEAAHLGDVGHGFVIVAEEVKSLATSTADSARNVGGIEKQLRTVSAQVSQTTSDSAAGVRRLATDLDGARGRSKDTFAQVRAVDESIEAVAAIAAQQSAALSAVTGAVEGIVQRAGDVAAAAQRAGALALGDELARLRSAIDVYKLGDRVASVPAATAELDDLPAELREAAAALRRRVDDDERDIVALVTGLAVSIAKNSFAWREIDDALRSLRAGLDTITASIDEAASGAVSAAEVGGRMRVALGAMREGFGGAIDSLAATLDRVGRVRESVASAASHVQSTAQAAERAATILDMIDAISAETTLLALNAAIESAHAGTAGSGFGVIADEIRVLAETTARATAEVAAVISSLAEASRSIETTIQNSVQQTHAVQATTGEIQESVGLLRIYIDTTLDHAAEVAAIVEQQRIALAEVRSAADSARRGIESDTAAATDDRRLELAMLGMRAHALAARRPLGTVAEDIRELGLQTAARAGAAFDAALDRGAMHQEDCFDTNYVELTGPRIAHLGRLFDVSKVSPSGFDPPKYETRYDALVEDAIDALIDEAVPQHPAITAMFAVDLNGYCFAHYKTCRENWTGDYTRDLNHNRIKRFFEDALSLRCSRVGLGSASDALPRRTPYNRFRDAGCALRRTGAAPWAIYTYARDTGVVYNDLSVGIFARDHRVGTLRIIYDASVV